MEDFSFGLGGFPLPRGAADFRARNGLRPFVASQTGGKSGTDTYFDGYPVNQDIGAFGSQI